ncbi:RDD family protein [Thalassomonas viridans]|uniref:RDD family protein n=2 Tax=Thalassomonas viridans TaxID=137584 RepID=A0AAF0CD37_9GAMM|nr:RDD family protein [Thalassomonas viridans]
MPGEILALVISVMLYRLGRKNKEQAGEQLKWRKTRWLARMFGIFIIFIVLLDTIPKAIDHFEDDKTKEINDRVNSRLNEQSKALVDIAGLSVPEEHSLPVSAIMIAATTNVALSECKTVTCWEKELTGTVEALQALALGDKLLIAGLSSLAAETGLSDSEQQQLQQRLLAPYIEDLSGKKLTPSRGNDNPVAAQEMIESAESAKPAKENPENKESKMVYSLLKLLEGIIEDLGLGFGWAALYFTYFTAMWGGQTPGKKLFGLKVLQLDGTPLSLWDSFGRYGGYGAGIATGLLGFLQIFWDANRQAIHDKISATVVIDVHKQQMKQK